MDTRSLWRSVRRKAWNDAFLSVLMRKGSHIRFTMKKRSLGMKYLKAKIESKTIFWKFRLIDRCKKVPLPKALRTILERREVRLEDKMLEILGRIFRYRSWRHYGEEVNIWDPDGYLKEIEH